MLNGRFVNRERISEFAPRREKLFKSPEEAPGCYFKRFSRDGRFMFAFGGESRFLVYPVTYKGKIDSNDSEEEEEEENKVKFNDFLRDEAVEIDVLSGLRAIPSCPELASSLLCRDFCLDLTDDFSGESRYLILAGSAPADRYEVDDRPPKTFLFRSDGTSRFIENDSHTAFPALDHVTFFLVDLRLGRVVDYLHFRYEFIYLAHHLGVSLDESTGQMGRRIVFSILSMKNQRIFLFKICDGRFNLIEELARNSTTNSTTDLNKSSKDNLIKNDLLVDLSWGRPGISGLILKLYRFLITERGGFEGVPDPLSILKSLHIWKHQLLWGGDRLLLRWCAGNLILSTNPRHQSMVHALDPLPPLNKPSFLAVFDIKSGRFEMVADSADERLLLWMHSNWTKIRGRSDSRDCFESILTDLKRAHGEDGDNYGLPNSLLRRFTNLIPQSPQQLVDSVWLDGRIFRWDPKISGLLSRCAPISCNIFSFDSSNGSNAAGGLLDGNYGPGPVKFFARGQSNSYSHSIRFVDETEDTNNIANTTNNTNNTANTTNNTNNDNTNNTTNTANTANTTNINNLDRHRWVNVLFHPTLPLIMVYQYGIFRSISMRVFFN